MKKSKIKKLVKEVRKSAKNELEEVLIKLITDAVSPLGILSKKTAKDINKSARALSKKLADKIKFEKIEVKEAEATEITTPVVAESKPPRQVRKKVTANANAKKTSTRVSSPAESPVAEESLLPEVNAETV